MKDQLITKDSAELIIEKSNQLKTISVIAQLGYVSELPSDDIESLFDVFICIAKEINSIAKSITTSI